MSTSLVYCTSKSAAKLELFDHLNAVCGEAEFEQPLPAGHAPPPPRYISARGRKMTKDDRESREQPDVFEDWDDDRLAKYYADKHEDEVWIQYGMFITLDARSADDNTLVLHHRRYEDKTWETWRIKFEDAFFMLVGMTTDDYQSTFVQKGRFTNTDGIFTAKEASKITQREDLKKARGGAQM